MDVCLSGHLGSRAQPVSLVCVPTDTDKPTDSTRLCVPAHLCTGESGGVYTHPERIRVHVCGVCMHKHV